MRAITDFAGIHNMETSEDGLFTMQEVECLGACVNAPMIQVNNEYFYEDLTYDSMTQLLQNWKDGKENKFGPQIDRQWSLGPLERTSLHTIPHGTHERDWDSEKAKWEEKQAAAAKK